MKHRIRIANYYYYSRCVHSLNDIAAISKTIVSNVNNSVVKKQQGQVMIGKMNHIE